MTEMGCAWLPPMLAPVRRGDQADPQDRPHRRARVHRRAQAAAARERVLRAELLRRREPTRPGRRGRALRDRPRPVHVGERLPARRGHLAVHARAPAPAVPRHRPDRAAAAARGQRGARSTTSTSTRWRRSRRRSARPSPRSRPPLDQLPDNPNEALLKASRSTRDRFSRRRTGRGPSGRGRSRPAGW